MRQTLFALVFAATATAAAFVPHLSWADDREMPQFIPELKPLVGTWKHVYKYKGKKEVPLFFVIKEDKGQLRLRFQLPVRDKKTDSDWDGQITLKMQVDMEQIQEATYRAAADPPRIEVSEVRRYTGSWKHKKHFTEGVYELNAAGELQYRCISRKSNEEKEGLTCFDPFVYQRVSDSTKWPD